MGNHLRKRSVLVAIGTRPEAIKLAPVIAALRREKTIRCLVCNTAQHREMVDDVLELFRIKSDFDLDVMKPDQTIIYIQNTITERFDKVLAKAKPDMVVVQGDTTTAFVTALVAFYHKIPVAHVEAGLRTFDKANPFPEEINRRLVSVVADLHLAPTKGAARNLVREGVPGKSIHIVGNTVVDALHLMLRDQGRSVSGKTGKKFSLPQGKKLILVTAHRRENWNGPLAELCVALKRLARERDDVEIVWPVHPHPKVRAVVRPALKAVRGVHLTEPLRYDEFVWLLKRAYFTITDSGGIQEESAAMGKPVLVFRRTTERPEVITSGVGELVPCTADGVFRRAVRLLDDRTLYRRRQKSTRVFGSGDAATRIAKRISQYLRERGAV